jgi:hypothetical protein
MKHWIGGYFALLIISGGIWLLATILGKIF